MIVNRVPVENGSMTEFVVKYLIPEEKFSEFLYDYGQIPAEDRRSIAFSAPSGTYLGTSKKLVILSTDNTSSMMLANLVTGRGSVLFEKWREHRLLRQHI